MESNAESKWFACDNVKLGYINDAWPSIPKPILDLCPSVQYSSQNSGYFATTKARDVHASIFPPNFQLDPTRRSQAKTY